MITFAGAGPVGKTAWGEYYSEFADGKAASARFENPLGVAVSDKHRRVFVGGNAEHRVRVIVAGEVKTLAGTGAQGLKDGPALSAAFARPWGVAVDPAGKVFVADSYNGAIRTVANGQVLTLATGLSQPIGVALGLQGQVFVTDATQRVLVIQNGKPVPYAGVPRGLNIPGYLDGPALKAKFYGPAGLDVDDTGRVYVADRNNHRIRLISGGQVTTLAGSGSTGGYADGPLSTARFNGPMDVAVDRSGNVYVADAYNHRIRVISGGVVKTLAGSGPTGFGKGGFVDGPAATARFSSPVHLALDSVGNVYVSDIYNFRIRLILLR